jgi:cysteine synthase
MDKPTPKLSRRTVFAGAGTAGALAAAAALLPKAAVEAPVAAAQPEADTAKGGYQVTQHVLRYYQTTRV